MALAGKTWSLKVEGFSPEFWLELKKVANSCSPSSTTLNAASSRSRYEWRGALVPRDFTMSASGLSKLSSLLTF